MKKGLAFLVVTFLTASQTGLAGHGYLCPKIYHGGYGKSCCQHGELAEKFFMKAQFILENQEALSLTEDQVNQIKGLKRNVKRALIQSEADIEILKIDIHERMREYPVDGNALQNLTEQKYEIKKMKAGALAQSYAQVKNLLNEEQYRHLKDLWKSQK